ncbi:MAG: selenium cofactor biosynthesis protein YqeC [Haloarculaceae archaeon]
MTLVSALRARGLVCLTGAGGKKTTLYALARRLERPIVTATVRIPVFDDRVARVSVTDDPVAAVRAADDWPVGVVPAREGDRYLGYDPDVVADLPAAGAADDVLVKADGARSRLFKAPGEDEPRIPSAADTVIPVASVRAVGEPLSESHVHRPERVAALTGLSPGDAVGPADVATVLAHPDGGLKHVPDGATVVPLLNMVDDPALRETGEAVADALLAATDRVERVVLARMLADDPVVAVVA